MEEVESQMLCFGQPETKSTLLEEVSVRREKTSSSKRTEPSGLVGSVPTKARGECCFLAMGLFRTQHWKARNKGKILTWSIRGGNGCWSIPALLSSLGQAGPGSSKGAQLGMGACRTWHLTRRKSSPISTPAVEPSQTATETAQPRWNRTN